VQRYSTGKIDRASYTRLFEAADTFAKAGLEKRCQEVLAGIKELSEKVEAEAPAQPRTTPATPRTDTPRERTDNRAERLRAAQPINTVNVSAETLVGSDVRNLEDKDLGDVSDVIMEKGQISQIVIGRGGFLGMGVHYHMIPANQSKVATSPTMARRPWHWLVVVNMTDEQFKAIPRVKKERGQWVAFEDDRRATPPPPP
jgi:hypothetical protein